jgi:hypothetical protein
MNDDELEQQLRELPAPALPESWREAIVATARREVPARPRERETWPAVLIYLRHVFARNPVTTGALTALWLLILVLKTATPADPAADRLMAQIDPREPIHIVSLAEEIRLAESWQDEPERTPMP